MSTIKYGLNCKKAYYDGGAVDGCDCKETLRLIAEGGPDAELLITHTLSAREDWDGEFAYKNLRIL